MTELRTERVQELGESSYLALKETYGALAGVKKMVDELHRSCLEHGSTLDYDQVAAIRLVLNDLFGNLERYLLPGCDPSGADDQARAEAPPF